MGSEAACHFSEDDGGAERSLAAIIGIGHVASGDESEQVVAVASHGAEELAGGLVFRRFGEETVEPAVEIGAILLEGGVLEGLSPSADGDGALQEGLEAWCEDGIAVIDGVLGVTQEMGEADLPLQPMAVLGRIAVGYPDLWHGAAQEVGDHFGAAARSDHMIDRR